MLAAVALSDASSHMPRRAERARGTNFLGRSASADRQKTRRSQPTAQDTERTTQGGFLCKLARRPPENPPSYFCKFENCPEIANRFVQHVVAQQCRGACARGVAPPRPRPRPARHPDARRGAQRAAGQLARRPPRRRRRRPACGARDSRLAEGAAVAQVRAAARRAAVYLALQPAQERHRRGAAVGRRDRVPARRLRRREPH
eukprot:scaffold56048_cov63-Phaeocystis_antarctica.AAC.1